MVKINATDREVKIVQAIASALAELNVKPYLRHKSFERVVQDYAGRGIDLEEIQSVLGTPLDQFVIVEGEE